MVERDWIGDASYVAYRKIVLGLQIHKSGKSP